MKATPRHSSECCNQECNQGRTCPIRLAAAAGGNPVSTAQKPVAMPVSQFGRPFGTDPTKEPGQ